LRRAPDLPRFKTLSIKTQLLLVVVVTGLILFSVVFFTYFQVTAMVEKNNAEYTRDVLYQIDQRINDNCDLLEKIMRSVAFDSLVQDYMLETDPLQKYQIFYKLKPNFLNLVSIKEGILDLGVENATGTSYFVRGPNAAVQKVLDATKDRKGFYYSGIVEIPYDDVRRRCFLLVADIVSVRSDATRGQVLGTAVVVFDASVLGIDTQSPIEAPESKFFLVDRNDLIFSSNDPTKIMTPLDPQVATRVAFGEDDIEIGGQRYLIHDAPITRFGGRIVSLIPENVLFGDLVTLRNLILLISVLASLVLLGIFVSLVRNILTPLNKFVGHLDSLQTSEIGGLRQPVGLTGYAEINTMALRFNTLLQEIEALTTRNLQTNTRMFELQLQQKKLEIAQLKKQINPHFLYNSLESMKGVAVSEHAPKVFDMITALGRLYYYSFKGSDDVRVREELETILSYVRIQQVRFEDRLQFSHDVPEEVMDCMIPKMILQPIVENAVYHGLEGKLEPGHLRIEGRIERTDLLRFRILDDGVGIEPDVLSEIQRHLEDEDETSHSSFDTTSGIGVMNVHSRIRLLYGAPYGMAIQSEPGRGTTIVIDLPVRRNQDA
jgi:two-component system, sensor histidine kinase YesM